MLGANGVWTFSFLTVAPVPPAGGRAPRPGLLTRIDNGIGAVTEIVYQTTQDLDAQFTDTDPNSFPWTSHVPVVVPVVTRISTRDQKTAAGGPSVAPFAFNRTTRFEYRDPAYDPWERSFRGFRRVRNIKPSGEVEQTWFWYGDCAGDGFVSVNCMQGSDEWTDKALMGVPVRVDRFSPGAGTRPDQWLLTTTMRYDRDAAFITPPGPHPDRQVSFARIGDIDTYVYDTALAVSQVDRPLTPHRGSRFRPRRAPKPTCDPRPSTTPRGTSSRPPNSGGCGRTASPSTRRFAPMRCRSLTAACRIGRASPAKPR